MRYFSLAKCVVWYKLRRNKFSIRLSIDMRQSISMRSNHKTRVKSPRRTLLDLRKYKHQCTRWRFRLQFWRLRDNDELLISVLRYDTHSDSSRCRPVVRPHRTATYLAQKNSRLRKSLRSYGTLSPEALTNTRNQTPRSSHSHSPTLASRTRTCPHHTAPM